MQGTNKIKTSLKCMKFINVSNNYLKSLDPKNNLTFI